VVRPALARLSTLVYFGRSAFSESKERSMTNSEAASTETSADDGVQRVPVVINVQEVPVAANARDKLLNAIGQEAQIVTDRYPGQASTPLEALARAYALVTTGTTEFEPVGSSDTVVPQTRGHAYDYGVVHLNADPFAEESGGT